MVRSAVYAEYAARERISAELINLDYYAAILPVAADKNGANRDYVKRLHHVVDVIYGNDKPAVLKQVDSMRKAWETMFGVKWGSPEFDRFQRDQALAAELLKKRAT